MALANIMCFDCETGGLSSVANPITQFAAIMADENLNEINRFQTFIKPYNNLKIEQKALDMTMTSMDQINKGADVKAFVEMLIKFAKMGTIGSGRWIKKPEILGHNVPFDIAFAKACFTFCSKNFSDYFSDNNGEINYYDTIKLARLKWPKFSNDEDNKYRLGSCCERMGIILTDAHGAMADTVATLKLFRGFSSNLVDVGGKTIKTAVSTEVEEENTEEEEKSRKFFRF